MITCNRCLFDSSFVTIHEDGECEYCKLHDTLEANASPEDWKPLLEKIQHKGRKDKYDCLIGISGGWDSAVLLYAAVRLWNLRPLVIHFDNGWNAPEAKENMELLKRICNVDMIVYSVNKPEYDRLNDAFLAAGLPDADIPNDIAMTKLMYDTAHKYGIKYILNGHDFRTEGSTPAKWTYMDAEYIRSVYAWYMGGKFYESDSLHNYPLFTFKDQLLSWWRGIKQVRPFHYGFDRSEVEERLKRYGFKDYGGKHCENIYTEFVGSYLLPTKFQIDKRIVYLSARVRSGIMSRKLAEAELSRRSSFEMGKLGDGADRIWTLLGSDHMKREDFKRYNFKKYRLVIWFLYKAGVVPYTFYKKYCF